MSERETVTEAAVEIAAKAMFAGDWNDCPGSWTWEDEPDDAKDYWRKSARAALEAALPLIVAGEMASQQIDFAKEARDLKNALSENAYPAADGTADIDNHALPIIEVTLRNIAGRAAAIRADKGGDPDA